MRFCIAIACVAALAGCGDNLRDEPDAAPASTCRWDPPADDRRFTEPEDFPREGCRAGAFDGADLTGIWRLEVDAAVQFSDIVSLRLEHADGHWRARLAGGETDDVVIDDDDVIIRRALASGLSVLDLCALEGGEASGTFTYCNGLDECVTGAVVGRRFEPLDEPQSRGMTLLGEYGPWPTDYCGDGYGSNVRVQDGIAYLARYGDGLRILDISDPSEIVELGHVPTTWEEDYELWNDVKLADGPTGIRYALMASSTRGVVVVDVSTPAAPSIATTITPPQLPEGICGASVHTLFVDAGRAYLSYGYCGLEIWDVQDPAAPIRLSGPLVWRPYRLHDLYVVGDRAYLGNIFRDVEIVDVSDPAATVIVGTLPTPQSHSVWVTEIGGRTIAAVAGEGLDSHLEVVDVTEGTAEFLTELAEWETRPEVSIHNVMAVGTHVFVAYYHDGVRVLDLADPENPVEVAHYQTWTGLDGGYGFKPIYEGALGIDVHPEEQRVYVADSHRGLMILEYDLP